MLFTVLKNTDPGQLPKKIFSKLKEGTQFNFEESRNNFCIFTFDEIKGIVITYSEYQYFFLNTFNPTKISEFEEYYFKFVNDQIKRIKFNFDIFKRQIVEKKYKIIEIEAFTGDPICEEILISGADLEKSKEFQDIIHNGQIKKVVLYFQNLNQTNEGFILKIFSEGKLSIIPDFDFDYLNEFFKYLLGLIISV